MIQELAAGNRWPLSELRLRLQSYYKLPVRNLGAGHWDERKGRVALLLAMAEFDHDAPNDPKSIVLFSRIAPSLRNDVLAIIHGADFQDFPDVAIFRAKARLASNIEIGIERNHAMLHRGILAAPNRSEAYAALGLRKREITESAQTNVNKLQDFDINND